MTNLDRRKNKRIKLKNGVALTPNGACQIIDMNKRGLSFKCFNEKELPDTWSMDIYDSKNLSLEKLIFRRIWQKKSSNTSSTSLPEVQIGGVFVNLSSSQLAHLYSYLLERMEAENESNFSRSKGKSI